VSDKGEDVLVRENFTSVTTFVRATVPLMTHGGSIVNLTSIEAHRGAPGFAVYSAMKAAIANLTKTLAVELGDRGIRVNCVAPDVVPTPGIGWMEDVTTPGTPLGRLGHVDDVAGVVAFLAGDQSSFVTGATIHVDGGNWAAGGWHRQPDGSFAT
jgi:NAD(P)-dependent dehydrogenase (short-subunit alcohol dehydrogenase family)